MSAAPKTADHVLAALPPQKLFIGGKWVDSDSAELLEVRSPSTGKLLAKVPHASAKDVDRAVESARGARDAWRLTPPFERAAACHRIADRIARAQGTDRCDHLTGTRQTLLRGSVAGS